MALSRRHLSMLGKQFCQQNTNVGPMLSGRRDFGFHLNNSEINVETCWLFHLKIRLKCQRPFLFRIPTNIQSFHRYGTTMFNIETTKGSKVARRESVVSNSHLGQGKVLTVPFADIPHLSWKFMWAFLRTPVIRRLSESLFVFKTYHIFIFFSRTTGPISIKRGTKHPWVTGIQERSNEGIRPFQGEIITKIAKFKNLFLQNHLANFNQTWHKTSLGEEDSKLFK